MGRLLLLLLVTAVSVGCGHRDDDLAAAIRGFLAATEPGRGWVVAARLGDCRTWHADDGAGTFREVTRVGRSRFEVAGQYRPRRGYVVAPSGLAYVDDHVLALGASDIRLWRDDPRRLLQTTPPSAWRLHRSTFAGRPTYTIESPTARFVVDRRTYAPVAAAVQVDLARCGVPAFGRTGDGVVAYRYLRPGAGVLRLRTGLRPAALLPWPIATELGERPLVRDDVVEPQAPPPPGVY